MSSSLLSFWTELNWAERSASGACIMLETVVATAAAAADVGTLKAAGLLREWEEEKEVTIRLLNFNIDFNVLNKKRKNIEENYERGFTRKKKKNNNNKL